MKSAKRAPPGEVRLIGGQWKRSKLPVPPVPGLRPTPDRVRETLFNWLGQDLSGLRCLDLFAGSGALGLEAASRGARDVLLVERDAQLVGALRQHVARFGAQQVQIHAGDALQWLAGAQPGWDVVFLDPPFGAAANGWNEALIRELMRRLHPALRAGAWVYLEAARPWRQADLPADLPWHLHRHGQAGAVHYHLFRRGAEPESAPDGPVLEHTEMVH
jgi:16S rRNA (guanine(966)-N(2))-methyltransferase RsmD